MDRKKLALIHILKKELNLTDAEYRDILHKSAGVHTAKDLTDEKFRSLMNYFVRSKHYTVNRHGMSIKQKMYIESLCKQIDWTTAHFNNFIHKYYQVDHITDLSRRQASGVIESLKNIKKQRRCSNER